MIRSSASPVPLRILRQNAPPLPPNNYLDCLPPRPITPFFGLPPQPDSPVLGSPGVGPAPLSGLRENSPGFLADFADELPPRPNTPFFTQSLDPTPVSTPVPETNAETAPSLLAEQTNRGFSNDQTLVGTVTRTATYVDELSTSLSATKKQSKVEKVGVKLSQLKLTSIFKKKTHKAKRAKKSYLSTTKRNPFAAPGQLLTAAEVRGRHFKQSYVIGDLNKRKRPLSPPVANHADTSENTQLNGITSVNSIQNDVFNDTRPPPFQPPRIGAYQKGHARKPAMTHAEHRAQNRLGFRGNDPNISACGGDQNLIHLANLSDPFVTQSKHKEPIDMSDGIPRRFVFEKEIEIDRCDKSAEPEDLDYNRSLALLRLEGQVKGDWGNGSIGGVAGGRGTYEERAEQKHKYENIERIIGYERALAQLGELEITEEGRREKTGKRTGVHGNKYRSFLDVLDRGISQAAGNGVGLGFAQEIESPIGSRVGTPTGTPLGTPLGTPNIEMRADAAGAWKEVATGRWLRG
jgi:hypothetical protein